MIALTIYIKRRAAAAADFPRQRGRNRVNDRAASWKQHSCQRKLRRLLRRATVQRAA